MDIGLSQQTLTSKHHSEAKKAPQFFAAICATLGGFVMGLSLGWSSPANDRLHHGEMGFNVSKTQNDLIGSIMTIGALLGAGMGGSIANAIGRRSTMIVQIVPSVIGWALIIWAKNVPMLIAGRVVTGFTSGLLSVAAPLYTNEISQLSIRGMTGTMFQLQCTIGIVFVYVVGASLRVDVSSGIYGVFPIVYALLMLIQPESPKYLLLKGRRQDAIHAMERLRGPDYDSAHEINEVQNTIDIAKANQVSIFKAFSTTAAKKGLFIGIAIMFFQQFSGINAIVFFTNDIFLAAGSHMSSSLQTIIVGSIMVVATFLSTLIIDRLGRKPLLLLSDAVMAISAIALGVFFYMKLDLKEDVSNLGWLPLLSLSVFCIVFSLGFGPIPWMFMSEIFTQEVQGPACSIACLLNWAFAFTVTMGFNSVQTAVGAGQTFWMLGGVSIVGTVFVAIMVPETKGRTLDQVVAILSGHSSKL